MKDKIKEKKKIDWAGLFYVVSSSLVLSILAMGLPKKICNINMEPLDCLYGQFASYVIMMLLFWNFFRDAKVIRSKDE